MNTIIANYLIPIIINNLRDIDRLKTKESIVKSAVNI